jgi:hypothetical protein
MEVGTESERTSTNMGKCESNREERGNKVVGNLAPSVFRPLATEGLHLKNYQL